MPQRMFLLVRIVFFVHFFALCSEPIFCLGLFQADVCSSLEDPSLQLLVPQMVDLLVGSSALNTVQKSSSKWKKWQAWAKPKLGVSVLPAVPLQVALYLTEVTKEAVDHGHSVVVIEYTAYSIRWGHRMAGMESPSGLFIQKSHFLIMF